MKKIAKLSAAVLAMALATGSASAGVYEFSFTDTGGDTAHGWLTTNASDVAFGIIGSFNTSAITGLTGYAGADQQLLPATAPYVDFAGISFTANGVDYNWSTALYPTTGGLGNSVTDPGGFGNSNLEFTKLSVSAVPEVSTWLMMLAGFAGLGFAGYRRNKAATLAA